MLQGGLASYLEVPVNAVQLTVVKKGSVKVTVKLPKDRAQKLVSAFNDNDPELRKHLDPLPLITITPIPKLDWYAKENLERAWKFARIEMRDDFVFDVIEHADIKHNLTNVLESIHTQLRDAQYYPAPLLRVDVPKNYHSVRPGTTVSIIDLIVLYALAQQLAPLLDPVLSDSAYAYRLNPEFDKKDQPLFADRREPTQRLEKQFDFVVEIDDGEEGEPDDEVDFPYGWFENWIAFHVGSRAASKQYEYAAITDITAFFENVSLDLLRERLKERLTSEQRELIDRLFRLFEYWDWTPARNLPQAIGLPQGNDVSAFLANLYLMDLDVAMLEVVQGDTSKYYRYVDDIKLFTSDQDQARRGLVRLEKVLRTLNLNVQSAKTKIVPAKDIFDSETEQWIERMSDEEPQKVEHAQAFIDNVFAIEKKDTLQRPYFRCLTVLRESKDARAVPVSLAMFLDDPSSRLLNKNFTYLRNFITTHSYCEAVFQRLTNPTFIFPYHRAYLYRLAAYSRDEHEGLKQTALQEATNTQSDWYCRMAALFCLGTFALTGRELADIARIIDSDANPQVLRAAFVTLCQQSGGELRRVLDRVSFFNAPHQDYLRRYFFRLFRDPEIGRKLLSGIKSSSIESPTFTHNLHKLDLLKASLDPEQRALFKEVIERKMRECPEDKWPRLAHRLAQIHSAFVVKV